jgi:endogenous inhibitor of DNA gyrase (YacG/DUF329 family)
MTTMANNGGFYIPCPCGQTVVSPERVATCPHCGRVLDVTAWGAEPVLMIPDASAERTK